VVVGDAVEQGLQAVGAALERGLAGAEPLVVGDQPVAAGAIFLRRGGRRHQRHAGLPQPDVGLLVQEATRLLEVASVWLEPRVRPTWSSTRLLKRPTPP